jgi:voltage-gated potassium channel
MALISRVLKKKRPEMLVSLFVVFILLLISSSLMFFLENEAQPDAFSSIPAAMWWGIATLTTVGYGDIYPVTVLGKLCSAVISVLGIGAFALPSGLLVSGFIEEAQSKGKPVICPHCEKNIEVV